MANAFAIEVLADGGIRMGGLATMAVVRTAIADANSRGIPIILNGAVDAALAATVVDEVRRTATTVEVTATDPRPWPHRWSSVQFAADAGLVAGLEDLLARGASERPRRGPSAYRLAMRRGHVPALVALRAAGARTPRGTTPPSALPDAVVLRPYLPRWTWTIALGTAIVGLIGIVATRQWAFLVVAVSGAVMVGVGNGAAGSARVAIHGSRLAVHPFARWHGPGRPAHGRVSRLPSGALEPDDRALATRRARRARAGHCRRARLHHTGVRAPPVLVA
jgi:hypothetical protein